ncbi:hypothetical protein OOK31_17215 [Streptomyces sp. NBC_00249]|uniref:hypothetical protein n=1 Tax=Streptomyces sp. NBC_00249 TaxID=2975690 RepID=UPI002251A25D|nr:hypothetical protein [Streptomyces sp. NBC_00249]MCX5195623.1 hypothetical protein [Streptomyces sp. NBC_00249]
MPTARNADSPTAPYTPFLLRGERFEDTFRQAGVDYQRRFRAQLRTLPADVPEPALVVLTSAHDAEVDRLSLELGLQGFPLYRIDADDCAERRLVLDPEADTMRIDGLLVRPVLLWIRHFVPNAVVTGPSPLLGRYVRDQWAAVLEVVREWPTTHVNPPASRRASRLAQLRQAAAAGVPVPRTVLASSTEEAAASLGCRPADLIAKVPGDHFVQPEPAQVTGAFPRRVTPSAVTAEPVPLLFQQYLPHTHEVRVFNVGTRLFAYEIRKHDPRDVWARPESVSVTATDVPAPLARHVTALLARTGYSFSGFDFLATPEGTPVFLECNGNGDWAWFERGASDDRVSEAALDHFTTHPALSRTARRDFRG